MKPVTITLVTVAALALLAATARAQAPDGAAVFEKACAQLSPESCRRLACAQPGRAGAAGAGNRADRADDGQHVPAGLRAHRRRPPRRRGLRRGPGGRARPRRCPPRGAAPWPRRALRARDLQSGWNGWGAGVANTRYSPAATGGVTAPMMPRMKLKWAFGFAGVSSARSQPAVLGNRVFVGSESGDIFALDAKTGCTHWSYHAQAGIRTALSVGPYKPATGPAGFAVYFADGTASAYAMDAATGKEIWARKVDSHPYAKATGSVTVHDGRVYVPLAGVGEEGQGGGGSYECCTFRGSVSALNANTGAVIWKSYTIADEPKPRGKNSRRHHGVGPRGRRHLGGAHDRRRSARRSTSRPVTATRSPRSSRPTPCSRST